MTAGRSRAMSTREPGGRRHDTQRDFTPSAAADPLVIALRLALAEVAERREGAKLRVVDDAA